MTKAVPTVTRIELNENLVRRASQDDPNESEFVNRSQQGNCGKGYEKDS